MIIQNKKELEILKEGGKRLADILRKVSKKTVSGAATKALDEYAEELIKRAGAKPAFKGYGPQGTLRPYPAALCVSINDEIVHAVPSGRILKTGDIVSLDLGLEFGGFFTDAAVTLGVGKISEKDRELIEVTKKALDVGLNALRAGAALGDFGYAVQAYVESKGFKVIRELVGHGVGKGVHEGPEIPNWGKSGRGLRLKEGMVIAIEPMAAIGSSEIIQGKDGWSWKTKDGSNAAHFEHSVVIGKKEVIVLTK